MIPLRFHIVSLIGVFLALAIGIVVGSTVVDRAIVEGLENRIETVSENLDRRQQANDELRAELDRLRSYVDRSATHTVEGRLAERTVAVVAARGADAGAVKDATILLNDAGAVAPAVLWLEPQWLLGDVDARQRLADALGIPIAPADTMRARAWRMLVEQLVDPAPLEPGVPPTAPEEGVAEGEEEPPPSDTLTALITAGFVTAEPVGSGSVPTEALATQVDRMMLVGTTDNAIGSAAVVVPMARAAAGGGLPVLVAEVDGEAADEGDEDPAHGSPVREVRSDEGLQTQVSTVDHLGRVTGRVAAVLALRDLGSSIAGHYGFDDGADEVVPERASR